jgi:hypothetical protein
MKQHKLAAFLLCCIFSFLGCGPRLAEKDIRAKIESTIPIGSPRKDVIQFLTSNSFDFIVDPTGVPPKVEDPRLITASLKQKVLWKDHYTVVDFYFDQQNDLLVEYKIQSFYPRQGL